MTETDPVPGRRTSISTDPIGADPIGNDPLDFSDAPPVQGAGPNRTIGGWLGTAAGVFTLVIVLALIMIGIILVMNRG